ncbi:MAG TPA: acyl-CoA dehydrogenase family protein, partial [Kutzneria sp.]|nr:acyl-CoA dehydrogenase family protein [Kutzneria sp.]
MDPLDLLGVADGFSDEERLIRDTVRQFVDAKVRPNVGRWFADGTFPRELAPELGELGLFGMHLDGYGCAGASATAYGIA